MASRTRLFKRNGILIYEVDAPTYREWVLNDIGSANFIVPAAGMEPYIEIGNYVLIEDDKLDAWVGVIETPRPWTPNALTVNAKSAMRLFGLRVGNYQQLVTGSWGQVFSQVIGVVNAAESTPLKIGDYADGISYSSVVDMSNPYTYLQRALTQARTRLDFRPVVSHGKLTIYVDMQPELYTAGKFRLEEGLNIKNATATYLEQGDIYNDITILAIGLDQVKYTARAIDALSVEKFGLRQTLFSEGQSQSDVDRLAVVRLAQYAWPRKTLGLVTGNEDETFRNIRSGYSGSVELFTQGYRGSNLGYKGTAGIRVLQYDDKTKEAVLVSEDISNG